jgi:hypothetical protein
MTKYKKIQNLNTGKDEFTFNAKLLDVGETVIENVNGKEYKVVTLGFQLPNGKDVQRTAICYASNYEYGIEEGQEYLCNLSFGEQGDPHIRMSHLTNSDRASADDFVGLYELTDKLIEEEMIM